MKANRCGAISALRHPGVLLLWCVLGYLSQPLSLFAQTTSVPAGTDLAAETPGDADVRMPPSLTLRQSQDDAWWTGPMLANSAGTLPPGHFLIEPYIYDVSSAHSNSYGSRAYVFYGLANRLTVGMIPIVGYSTVSGGKSSSSIGL